MEQVDFFVNTGESFSDILFKKTPDQISIEVSEMNLTEHLSFTSETFNKLGIDLKGDGMEIAAGAGVFASSITRLYPNVTKMYALEIVPRMVTKLQPKIIDHTNMTGRVIPMIGDFNDIKLPNASLDFVVGFNALHHSNTLHKTLSEIGRVLKPGGKLIFFDRAHPNFMSLAQENFLLEREYWPAYKIDRGLDLNKSYKRTDNGEHEPRFRDWNKAFEKTGMKIELIAVFAQRTFKRFIKVLFSLVPFIIRKKVGKFECIIEHPKLLLFYIFPWLAQFGKLKYYTLHINFTTGASKVAMKKMIFIASKKKS